MLYELNTLRTQTLAPLLGALHHMEDCSEGFIKSSSRAMIQLMRSYGKPHFNLQEKIIQDKVFARLLFFAHEDEKAPTVLVVPPMAGHYSTLLRKTIKAMKRYNNIYVVDWKNIRDIPKEDGDFSIDTYIDYLWGFTRTIGKRVHIAAVCQPVVEVLALVSLMHQCNDPLIPLSMTLMAGPINTEVSPTMINMFAKSHSIDWFKHNMIYSVPKSYKGAGRMVYPGFLQLANFMSMNLNDHIKSFAKYIIDDSLKKETRKHRDFYGEYLAVMDLSESFFISTIQNVFHDNSLMNGQFKWYEHIVDPKAITHTPMLVIEGGKDDITGLGQTKAAMDLCSNLSNKFYHLEAGVGHYGVFSGHRFKENILLIMQDFFNNYGI